jgi:hypothetical protein
MAGLARHFPQIEGQSQPTKLHRHLLQPAKMESSKPEILFGMPKYTLDVRFSLRVECGSPFTMQFGRFFGFEFLVDGVVMDLAIPLGLRTVRFERTPLTGLAFVNLKVALESIAIGTAAIGFKGDLPVVWAPIDILVFVIPPVIRMVGSALGMIVFALGDR